MKAADYDVIVVGGGPGGSSVATYLANAGKRVLVLEREQFPRFHIGESLLPYNRQIFKEMGVLPTLETAGFLSKLGAQFHLGNASKSLKLVFRNGRWTREISAFQVERSTFDDLLLKHATKCGAEVRHGWTVNRSEVKADHVSVRARNEEGREENFTGSFLADASGRGNFTGNQEGIRVTHAGLKKVAIFGHFENVILDEGSARGDTVIMRLENKWFWIIPISDTKTSVGCVMDQEEFSRVKKAESATELFNRYCEASTAMRERMSGARAVSPIQTTADFSYYNKRFSGPRLVRIGDAAGFIDPIFSAGVYLAMYSGKHASKAIIKSLAQGGDGTRFFGVYDKRVLKAMAVYWDMVEGFYTTPFMELFMQPRPKLKLPDAIVAVLAGELEGGPKIGLRLKLFLWMAQMQKRWALVPRISFKEGVKEREAAKI
jgi:FADH2-dependent halogenase